MLFLRGGYFTRELPGECSSTWGLRLETSRGAVGGYVGWTQQERRRRKVADANS